MSSDENLKAIKQIIIENCAFFDAPMNDLKLKMFAQELGSLRAEDVAKAMHHFRQEKGRRQMPMPADIKSFLDPKVSDDSEAEIVAGKIQKAISSFGHTNPGQAKEYIGDLGWRVVDSYGGWYYICANAGSGFKIDTARAQWRNMAKAFMEKDREKMSPKYTAQQQLDVAKQMLASKFKLEEG